MLKIDNISDVEALIQKILLLEDELQIQSTNWLMAIMDTQQQLNQQTTAELTISAENLEQLSFGLEIQTHLWQKPLKEIRDSLSSLLNAA